MEKKPNIDKSWALMESMLDAQLPRKNRDSRGVVLMLFLLILAGAILIIAIIKFPRDKNPLHLENHEVIVLSKHNDPQDAVVQSAGSTSAYMAIDDIVEDTDKSNKFVTTSEIVQISSESSLSPNFDRNNYQIAGKSLVHHHIDIDDKDYSIIHKEDYSLIHLFAEAKKDKDLIDVFSPLPPLDYKYHTVKALGDNQIALKIPIALKQDFRSIDGYFYGKNRIFLAGGILTQNANGTEIGLGYNRAIIQPLRRVDITAGLYFNKLRFDPAAGLNSDSSVEVSSEVENMDEKDKLIFNLPNSFFSVSTNLAVEYQLENNFYLKCGVQYLLRLINDENAVFIDRASSEGYFSNEINGNSVLKRSDFRLQLGAGFRFSSGLELAILYHQGTTPLINQSLQPNRNLYFGSLMLTMGYNF